MTRLPHWTTWSINCGLLLIAAGVLIPLLTGQLSDDTFRYVYACGAALALIGRLFAPKYTGSELRIRRLKRIEVWSALFFCVAAFFAFYDRQIMRDWLAFTLAGAAVQAYASLMLSIYLSRKK